MVGRLVERLVRIIKELLRRSLGKSISVKSTKPEKVLNTNDAIVKKYTSSGRLVKEPKRLDLLNYNCYRGSDRVVVNLASPPQIRGSILGLGKIDSAFHPFSGAINEACAWGLNTGGFASD
ncbi:hypothetical protein TNCV_407762 [Trichonephila clavipes]|nr:hypothetical protein TNCV_407762 [Trichonephila clavipes]